MRNLDKSDRKILSFPRSIKRSLLIRLSLKIKGAFYFFEANIKDKEWGSKISLKIRLFI